MAFRNKSAILGTLVAAAVLLVGPPCFVASQGRGLAVPASRDAAAVESLQPAGSEATMQLQDETEPTSTFQIGSAALSILAALLVALAPAAEAQAAKTGGRIGSAAPSRQEQRKPPPTARQAAPPPTVINKTTVVQKTVVVQPPPPPPVIVAPAPMISPFGMAAAPVVVAPPPTLGDVIVGAVVGGAINNAVNSTIPRGPSTTDRIMENQMRQDERQLDRQASQIEDLQRELRDLKK